VEREIARRDERGRRKELEESDKLLCILNIPHPLNPNMLSANHIPGPGDIQEVVSDHS
jgi:hypothetical protein